MFKDPKILGKHTLISQAEKTSGYPFNVGVLYVQNAAVEGPVRAVFSEMVRRYKLWVHLDPAGFREWRENKPDTHPGWTEIFSHIKIEESLAANDDRERWTLFGLRDIIWDQAVFNDAVESLANEHVSYIRALGRFLRLRGDNPVNAGKWERKQLGMVEIADGKWGVPAERMRPDIGPREAGEVGLYQRLVSSYKNGSHTDAKYSDFSASAGLMRRAAKAKRVNANLTAEEDRILQDIADATLDERLSKIGWVTVRNAAASETVAAAPGWVAAGWIQQFGTGPEMGSWGYWNNEGLDEGVPTAVAHVVGVADSKQLVMMAMGWWGPTPLPELVGARYITAGDPLVPVFTQSPADYYELLTRLTAVAIQTGGVAVTPLVDCASPWIVRGNPSVWEGVVPMNAGHLIMLPARCPFSARDANEVCCHFFPSNYDCVRKTSTPRHMATMGEFLVGRTRESLTKATIRVKVNVGDAGVTTDEVAKAVVATGNSTLFFTDRKWPPVAALDPGVLEKARVYFESNSTAKPQWDDFNTKCHLKKMQEEASSKETVTKWRTQSAFDFGLDPP